MTAEPGESTALGKLWSVVVTLLLPLAFLSLPAYPLFQIYALWKMRGRARLFSALPLVFMLPIYAYSFVALSKGSNLWPLFAIFASPVALIIVIAVMVVARKRAAERGIGSGVWGLGSGDFRIWILDSRFSESGNARRIAILESALAGP
jgi:hypothetical protein